MKRKDMLKKLTTLLENLETCKVSNSLKANMVLEELEMHGMRPPLTKKLSTLSTARYFEFVNDWEEEA